ncbi:hypothetical protein GCM10007108_01540 [Thermogymnomonas acidicola]|uniref:DUF1453 domain-containing protein n=1 Tax=Thermogymnomonas acidicola TaxID=399579 RepID=A0AA37BPK3_9ARCH|nr:hypothetical protein [Thermogymnomonas acidicola]GGM67174.1 hypothetical protein GCM10007108_01540 [Thermogymnomonas acidicola]
MSGIGAPAVQIPPSFLPIVLILVVWLVYRLYRGLHGSRFSVSRIVVRTVIYVLLFLTVVDAGILSVPFLIVALIAGLVAGLVYGRGVSFSLVEGRQYYRRSTVVMAIWLVGYIFRLMALLLYPTSRVALLASDLTLTAVTGLVIGEAMAIIARYRESKGLPEDI